MNTYLLLKIIGKKIYDYQNECRIYLDEYPEQKKLRKEYFKGDIYFINRWLKRN